MSSEPELRRTVEPNGSRAAEPAIIATGVSKRYRLGEREQYGALRDVVAGAFRRQRSSSEAPERRQEIWAVEDVSFTVAEGEVVGIIGRNGAGKSTLLKILSRITTPTAGEVRMRGRIGSLLEVGSGFHPELTGTENVYLNGAILGMSRVEIRAKLDEIVAFAEMDAFMDTPVKHYSVGMFMRLAFAVAAHLDAEILVVDEVLAVGDARFQQKCLAKMGEVARSGRSVLFVSHNLEATVALCDRGLVLDGGRLTYDGDARSAVDFYRQLAGVTTRLGDRLDLGALPRDGTGEARFTEATISAAPVSAVIDPGGRDEGRSRPARSGEGLVLDLSVAADERLDVASVGITIGTEGGVLLLNLDSADAEPTTPVRLEPGQNELRIEIPTLNVAPGRYRVGLRLANPVTNRLGSGAIDLLDPAFVLQVEGSAYGPTDAVDAGHAAGPGPGPSKNGIGDGGGATVIEADEGSGSVVRGRLRLQCPRRLTG